MGANGAVTPQAGDQALSTNSRSPEPSRPITQIELVAFRVVVDHPLDGHLLSVG